MTQVVYFKDTQLAARYNVTRATIWRWAREGRIPKPVSLSPGCTRWEGAELDAVDETRRKETQAA